MAKNDLIGGALWEHYSQKVSQRMDNPLHRGELTEEDAAARGLKLVVADHGAESCGDAVRLFWLVNPTTNVIEDAKFKSFGCGTAIASSDMMVELCLGKTVEEAVKITNLDVEKALRDEEGTPAVPPQKMHCSVMAYDVIKKAAGHYMGVDAESFEAEFIVCECARVSLSTLREVIRLNDLKTVEEITDYTKAGAFCKSCIAPGGHEKKEIYLVDVLREVRAEMSRETLQSAVSTEDFAAMTIVKKIKAIEKVLDEKIRPMLVMDGGNVEVLDVKDAEEKQETHVYIRYLGACSGCAGASTGTLFAIEESLRSNLNAAIRILPV